MCFGGGGGQAAAAPPPPPPVPAAPISTDPSILRAGQQAKLQGLLANGFSGTILSPFSTTPVPPMGVAGKTLLGGT